MMTTTTETATARTAVEALAVRIERRGAYTAVVSDTLDLVIGWEYPCRPVKTFEAAGMVRNGAKHIPTGRHAKTCRMEFYALSGFEAPVAQVLARRHYDLGGGELTLSAKALNYGE